MSKGKGNKVVNMRALMDEYREVRERMTEIVDLIEREDRTATEAENAEFDLLDKRKRTLERRISTSDTLGVREVAIDSDAILRETLYAGREVRISLQRRELMTTDGLDGTGIIPVDEQEMLKPLRTGLIYDKVGINIRTGLPAGMLRWPKHGRAKAYFVAEGESAVDSKIDFDKLEVKPERLTCAIPVTREELDSSQGIVESVVREEMPAAVVDEVNAHLFAVNGDGLKVIGPFVKAAESAIQFAGAVPTRKELLKMKAKVAASGIKLIAPCWVMTENMKAELEDAKVDAGSGRFVCENDRILGYPVFTTPVIGDEYVGFGDWSYQAAGFFGSMSMIVDPYTLARKNATDFVLNTHFATATLYDEAFVLGVAKA